jgi:hypothetical protein
MLLMLKSGETVNQFHVGVQILAQFAQEEWKRCRSTASSSRESGCRLILYTARAHILPAMRKRDETQWTNLFDAGVFFSGHQNFLQSDENYISRRAQTFGRHQILNFMRATAHKVSPYGNVIYWRRTRAKNQSKVHEGGEWWKKEEILVWLPDFRCMGPSSRRDTRETHTAAGARLVPSRASQIFTGDASSI